MKRCFKCGQEKDISEFYKHSKMADGHLGKCKECAKIDVKTRYDLKIEKIKEYERKRFQNQNRKEKLAEYQRIRRDKYPKKYKAHSKTSNALRDGRIEKQPCEVCGELNTQAHHDDYDKPLDVRWLCFKHHRLHHGQRHV